MKKQFKKSISLIMAVLMVLSCWVWVAPTKAEAAAEGSYDVYVTVNVSRDTSGFSQYPSLDKDGDGSCFGIAIEWKSDNATGSETGTEFLDLRGQAMSSDIETKITVPGFPTKIHAILDAGGSDTVAEVKKVAISSEKKVIFNGVIYLNSTSRYKLFSIDYLGNTSFHDDNVIGTQSGDNAKLTTASTAKWELPRPDTAHSFFYDNNGKPFTDVTDVTIPYVGEKDENGNPKVISKDFNFQVCDQYGVYWANNVPEFSLSQTEGGTTDMADEESGIWWVERGTSGKSVTVKINENMQKILTILDTNTDGYVDYYITGTCSDKDGTATVSRKIRVTYPKYDWNFDTKVQGSAYTADKVIMQDGSFSDLNNDSQPDAHFKNADYLAYGQKAAVYPVSAERAGFTFLGFWTQPQPAGTGADGEAFSLESSFKYPISQADYDALTDEEKEGYVAAGEKWDPKANSALLNTEGNKNYYAWWLSDDINVKFYDVDGKYLLEKTVKAGQSNKIIDWPTPTQQYVSGPFTYSNWKGLWEHADGTVVKSNDHIFWKDLVLTPLYDTVSFANEYNIDFYDTYGETAMYGFSTVYGYRETVAVPSVNDITALSEDDVYTYTFEGFVNWKPKNGNYHVMLEDVDFDANGNALNIIEDFTVRSDASYYPVFRRHLKSYDVYFEYINDQAEKVGVYKTFKYGEAITAPEGVPSVYAKDGYEYTFLGWTKSNVIVDLSKEVCRPDTEYLAKYSAPVPTLYTVSFVYKNEKGEDVTVTTEVKHGDWLSYDFIDSLRDKPYGTYDDGESQLRFDLEEGKWNYNGKNYTYDNLYNFSPKGHTTFTAVYEDGIPFYTVTYKDGNNSKAYRILSGDKLEAWTYDVVVKDEEGNETTETKTYLPAIADTEDGRYTFLGWYDEEQADIGATNGKKYEVGVTPVTGNVTLYPQFSFGKFEYHIQFLNWDGSVIKSGTFNYKDSYQNIIREAEAGAVRAADETYTYKFIGWDKKVPEFCEGGEPDSTITFTAQYKPEYIYYNIDWMNDENATTPLKTSKYIYGDRIFTPSVTLTPVGDDATKNYVFAGWYYKDSEGVEHAYNRNITVKGNMQFYAKYVEATAIYTVNIVPGKDADDYSFTVEDGTSLKDIVSAPVAGYIDATTHDEFAGWYTTRTKDETTGEYVYSDEFVIETATVTSNITLYADYAVSDHDFNKSEIKENPSYPTASYTDYNGEVVPADDGKGVKTVWCECSKEKTKKDEEIAALTDTMAPTGTGYIGRQWNTADGDINAVVYASPKTSLILTTTDKGYDYDKDSNAVSDIDKLFNPSALGIGVQEIHAAIYPANLPITKNDIKFADGEFAPKQGLWTKMYDWTQTQSALISYYGGWDKVPSVYQNYPGNATANVGDYNVTDGTTYKVYAVVIDKAGNWTFMETCSFVYDATAPVVDFVGNSNAAKDKFCGEVTISVTEANAYTVTANGTEIEAVDGVYKITAADYYNIVVEDIAGNKVSKYVTVTEGHDMQEYVEEATCLSYGFKTSKCSVCGYVDEAATEDIPSTGHKTTTKHIAATCTANGKDIVKCSECDLEETHEYSAGELLYPATGHSYEQTKDSEGNDVDKVYTTLAATCSTEGVGYKLCTVCGFRDKVDLPINPEAHNPSPVKIVKPTCTMEGSRTQVCRYNPEHVLINEVLEKTEHTYGWKVEEEAGCFEGVKAENGAYTVLPAYGKEVKYCTKCNEETDETRPIETLKDHFWVATKTDNGDTITIDYHCQNCSATKESVTVDKEKEIVYTVKFVIGKEDSEANEETDDMAFPVIRGASIAADAVEAPTKENSADGKHSYTFRGWFTEGGEEYVLGRAVYSNLKLYPKFTESNIVYEVQFIKAKGFVEVEIVDDDGKVIKTAEPVMENPELDDITVLTGFMGATNRKPSSDPVLKGNDKYSFKFDGWKDSAGNFVTDFTVKDNATYTAAYTAIKNEYNVVFMNGTEPFYVIENLAAGDDAVYDKKDAEGNLVYPEKAATAEKHYTFNGWYTTADCKEADDLKDIQGKRVVYAGYTAADHDFDEGTVTKAADCKEAGNKKFVCEICEFEKNETIAAEGHSKNGGTYDDKTGEMVYNCSKCGDELERTKASYTIKFFNDNGLAIDMITVPANSDVEFDYGENNANLPTKKADAQYTYTFAGWLAPDGTQYKMGAELPKATADIVYTAYYTSTTRTYTVRFANVNNDIVYEVEGVAYGASVDSVDAAKKYAYTEAKYGGKKANADGHYVFNGWDADITKIVGDTLARPTFVLEAHSFDGGKVTGATCTTPGGTKYTCACGYSYMGTETVPATGHDLKLIKTVEPDFVTQTDGKKIYKCQNAGCDYVYEEAINGKLAEIKVTVKDSEGAPVQNAVVQLYNKADSKQIGADKTGSTGVVSFWVQPGEYTVTVKVDGVGDTSYNVTVDENGNTTGNQDQVVIEKPAEEAHKCECSCHRDNFWGAFFRFFQKIIKLFTGKASCCADPDSRI